MKKILLIGAVVLGLALVAGLAKHHREAQETNTEMVAGQQASTNAPPPRVQEPANPAVASAPAARPQDVADLYTEVITKVEEALKNNK